MDILFQKSSYMPCCVHNFYINGKHAHVTDFGSSILNGDNYDVMENGCKYRYFEPMVCTQYTLDKYDIEEEEYSQITQILKENLIFINCKECLK